MKPYLLVIHNLLRNLNIHFFVCKEYSFHLVELMDRKMKFRLTKDSVVNLGTNIVSDGFGTIVVGKHGNLQMGNHVYFNEGIMISCQERIEIGDYCLFGPGVKLFDNDHYFSKAQGVTADLKCAPIIIGKNCWIAANAVILKGTIIGDNCVIGAGTVVHGEIPAGSIVTSNRELVITPMEDRR